MDQFDLRAQCISALTARGQRVKDRHGKATFRCIRHEDKNPSAWLGDHAWGCFSCGFEESIYTLADELGVERPKKGFTLEDYADAKGFNIAKLREWGLRTAAGEHGDVVSIPYRATDGAVLRLKLRHRKGTFWEGKGLPTHLYGLDMLAKYPTDPVILVEGESDCHAAWHHKVLAIGVPGANAWKTEWTPLLAERQVYVWQEPGEGGAAFVKRLADELLERQLDAAELWPRRRRLIRFLGPEHLDAAETRTRRTARLVDEEHLEAVLAGADRHAAHAARERTSLVDWLDQIRQELLLDREATVSG